MGNREFSILTENIIKIYPSDLGDTLEIIGNRTLIGLIFNHQEMLYQMMGIERFVG
jgi:hypothetical protein